MRTSIKYLYMHSPEWLKLFKVTPLNVGKNVPTFLNVVVLIPCCSECEMSYPRWKMV